MNAFLTSSLRLRGLPATLACLALGLAWPGVAAAQTTRTWSTSSTNPTWSVNTNWSDNTAPVANDSLAFASTTGTTSLTNDILAGTTFNGITFNSGASAYTLSGNSITLGGNVVNNSSSAQTIALPLSLSGTRTFTNNTTGTVTISGNISGAGGLIRDGLLSASSVVNLTGTNTFTGDITVNAGVLQVGGNGVLGTSGTYAGTITLGGATTNNRMVFMSDANQTLTGNIVSSTNDSIFFVQNGAPTGSGTVTLAAANPLFTSRMIVGASGQTNVSTLLLSHSNAIQNARLEPRSSNKIAFASGIGTFNVGSLADAGNIVLNDTAGNGITLSVGGNNRTEANYTGTLSGLGGLTKVGAGTLTLTGSNAYTGNTRVSGGTLVLSHASAASTGTVQLAGGTLSATVTSLTTAGIRVAAGDSGVLTASNASGVTTGTMSVDGTLTVQRSTGGTQGSWTTSALVGSGTFVVENTNGGVAPNSTNGRLILPSTSGFTGSVVVRNGGFLVAPGGTVNLASAVVNAGGLLAVRDSSTTTLTSLSGSGTVMRNGGAGPISLVVGGGTFSGSIFQTSLAGGSYDPSLGAMSLTKTSANTLVLSGSNAYAGTTTIDQGVLQIGDNGVTGSLPSSAISGSSGATLAFSRTDDYGGNFTNTISGGLGVRVNSGTLTLSGAAANTYSGTTTVSAGRLNLNKTAGVNAVAGNLAITGAAVSFGANNQIADTAAVTMSGSTSVFNGTGFNAGQLALTETIGSVAVTGGIFQTGNGAAITVTGTGTFDASTGYVEYLQNGGATVSFGGVSLIGMTGTTAISSARTGFALAGSALSTLTVGAGGLSLDGSNLLLQSANAATAYGRLILNGDVTTAGSVASSIMTPAGQAGIGRVELSGTAGTVSRTFTTAAGGANLAIAVPITNGSATTAGIEKAGAGVLTLSASNSYSGGSTVSVGTLRLGNANALGASTGALAVNGGTLDLGGFSVNVGALSGSAGAVITTANTAGTALLTTSAASDSTFAGTIQNNGSGIVALTKSGTGVLTLSGAAANTYSGTTTVSAGRLNLNKTAGVNAVAGNLAINSAAVAFGADNQIADTAAITMSGSASVFNGTALGSGARALFETIGSIAITGGAFQTGAGAITVTGTGTFDATTDYVEYVQNSGGSVSFGGLSLIGMTGTTPAGPARTGFTIGGNGLTSLTIGAGGLSLDGSNLLLQSANAATAYGRLILNGDVTTAGSVASSIMTPSGQAGIGRVELSNTAGTVSRTFTTAAGGANLAIAVPITNGSATTAGLVKAGLGTLTLSASNSYTGATTVNAGSLLVNGLLAGLGAVTVDPGATLGGSGSIAGAVTVNGFLSPGNSPGVLSVASLVLGESSTSVFEIDGLTRATQYDGTDVTGGLTYGGSLVIDFGSGITAALPDDTIFNLFDFGSYTGAFTSITTANDGSFYAGLTFTPTTGGDKWTATKESQTLEFTHSTGNLVIVPEPGAIALAAIGIAAASARVRYRRRK